MANTTCSEAISRLGDSSTHAPSIRHGFRRTSRSWSVAVAKIACNSRYASATVTGPNGLAARGPPSALPVKDPPFRRFNFAPARLRSAACPSSRRAPQGTRRVPMSRLHQIHQLAPRQLAIMAGGALACETSLAATAGPAQPFPVRVSGCASDPRSPDPRSSTPGRAISAVMGVWPCVV